MAESTQSVVSNGTLAMLDISFDYIERAEISVFFNSALTTAWSWSGTVDKRILFTPVVPNGTTVLVKRTTDISKLRHEFSKGAAFTAETMDEAFKQSLHIVQEAKEANFSGDFYNSINMNNFRIRNIGTAIDSTDALTLGQYQADANGANTAKTAAQASATAAATSASNAGTSATNAASSAASAGTSATTATTQASAASTSRTNAAASATAAGNSATNAANSATAAGTSATNAASSATAASTSATNAANASRLTTGTTTTGNAGTAVIVGITGSAGSQVLNLTIPRGDQGIQGPVGPAGPVSPLNVQNNDYVAATTAGTSSAYTLTLSPALPAYIPDKQVFTVNFHLACAGSPTLSINGLAALPLLEETDVGGFVPLSAARISADRTYHCFVVDTGIKVVGLRPMVMRNYINGFNTTAVSGATSFTVDSGQCANSTNVVLIDEPSVQTRTAAPFSETLGGGCLDTGAMVANTYYYLFAVRRPDNGLVRYAISTNKNTPAIGVHIPAAYTQFRRLPSILLTSPTATQWSAAWSFIAGTKQEQSLATYSLAGLSGVNVQLPLDDFEAFSIIFEGGRPTADAELQWRVLNGNTTYAGTNDYRIQFLIGYGTTVNTSGSANTTGIALGSMSSNFVRQSCELKIFSPKTTGAPFTVQSTGFYLSNGLSAFVTIQYFGLFSGDTSGINAARTGIFIYVPGTGTTFAEGRLILKGALR